MEYLNVLGKRALYYDTDSVFYVSDLKKGDNELPIGSMLGELTDELAEKGPGTFIESFVSGGRSYAYKFRKLNGECGYVCKVKGIRFDFANSQKINFESIRQMILYSVKDVTWVLTSVIRTVIEVQYLTQRIRVSTATMRCMSNLVSAASSFLRGAF